MMKNGLKCSWIRAAVLVRLLFGLLVVAAGGLLLFVDFAYQTFLLRSGNEKVDAIVVLAGGRGRVEEGGRLYRNNVGHWLMFVGVDPVVKRSDLYRGGRDGGSPDAVVLEKVSRNTLENAIYARDMLVARKVGSIVLITSRYHMKRAELIFKAVLPVGMKVFPHPVDSVNLQAEWWKHKGSLRLLFREFYKYYVYKVLFLFVSGEMRGDPLRGDQVHG